MRRPFSRPARIPGTHRRQVTCEPRPTVAKVHYKPAPAGLQRPSGASAAGGSVTESAASWTWLLKAVPYRARQEADLVRVAFSRKVRSLTAGGMGRYSDPWRRRDSRVAHPYAARVGAR